MSQTKTRRAALSSTTQTNIDKINTFINACGDIPGYKKMDFTIEELLALSQNASFETQPRAYQREKVASIAWKQDLISTVFTNGFYTIPEIHIRANRIKSNGFRSKAKAIITRLEMIDGQQRWTSIADYVDKQFPSKKDQPKMIIDGVSYDIANKFYSELPDEVKSKFLEFRIYSTVYATLSNAETANLFVEVLNNTNDLNDQEKRNAMIGRLPEGIRDIARDFNRTNPNMHPVFDYLMGKDGKKLHNFNSNFKTGRMEVDEYCAELLYLLVMVDQWTDGVSQTSLTNWYKNSIRMYTNKDEWNVHDKKLHNMLDDLHKILNAFPTTKKAKDKRSRLITQVMVLYYQELKTKYGHVDHESFVSEFLEVYKKWSSTSDQVYHGKTEWFRVLRQFGSADLAEKYRGQKLNSFLWTGDFESIDKKAQYILEEFKNILFGIQAFPKKTSWGETENRELGPFFNLFGGKNKNALTTIRQILEYERMMGSNEEWGISKRDPIRNFTDVQKDIIYERQSGKDFYDGKPLDRADAIADHDIPWSWGTERGGITTLENCVITSSAHNKAKGNMSGSQYKRDILLNPNATEDYFSR